MRANQMRLWFASLAYVLMEAVRRLALQGTDMANATAGSIRLKLLRRGCPDHPEPVQPRVGGERGL